MNRARVNRTLIVTVAKPYGNETIIPECETSRLFAELLEQKTLTRKDVERIKKLGYEIVVKEVRL